MRSAYPLTQTTGSVQGTVKKTFKFTYYFKHSFIYDCWMSYPGFLVNRPETLLTC
jgi:hypothetical protein